MEQLTEVVEQLAGIPREDLLRKDPEELDRLATLLSGRAAESLDRRCAKDALYWLCNHTATENPKYLEQNVPWRAPFPRKPYFVPLFAAFANHKRLFICKTREMLSTWAICGFSAHRAQFFQEEIVFQSLNEDKAKEGADYVRQLYDNQDEALKRRHPLKQRSTTEIAWADGGRFVAIPAGPDAIRAFHPSRFVLDEAAHTPYAQESYDSAHPVCPYIVAISTASPGWFANECAREWVE